MPEVLFYFRFCRQKYNPDDMKNQDTFIVAHEGFESLEEVCTYTRLFWNLQNA